MKKKGFTLIEMLGVLVILSLLALLIAPVITKVVKNNKQRLYDVQIETIEKAAKDYATKNMDILPEEGATSAVTLGQLKKAGLVQMEIRNPITKELFSDDLVVEIRNTNHQYTYKVAEENGGVSQ